MLRKKQRAPNESKKKNTSNIEVINTANKQCKLNSFDIDRCFNASQQPNGENAENIFFILLISEDIWP